MPENAIFERLRKHYDQKLPFVAFRKPESNSGTAFFQLREELFTTEDFRESGFVFAPFDAEKPALIIPENASEKAIFDTSVLAVSKKVNLGALFSEASEEAKQQHISLVKKGLSKLNSGDLQKVVLSRKEQVELKDPDAVKLFQELLAIYPSAFVYLWYHPQVGLWLGATPETLLKIEGRNLKTMALAGTQKFSGSMEVNWGEKERQEQQLVTDEILARLTGWVEGLKASQVHTAKAGNLLHLKTDISGRLAAGENLDQIIKALHPTPAVCGLPKEKAKEFILLEEDYDREFYTGFLGELNLQKNVQRSRTGRNVENLAYRAVKKETDLYVNLRCMKIEDGGAVLFVGGGITKDSVPEDEWQETVNKAETMKKVLLK